MPLQQRQNTNFLFSKALRFGDLFLSRFLLATVVISAVAGSLYAQISGVENSVLRAALSGDFKASIEHVNAVLARQYAPVEWPWGDYPRLPRTPWPPSPWRAALFDGDHQYEHSILWYLTFYLVLHAFSVHVLSKIVGEPLKQRPTIIASTFHALTTALISTLLLIWPMALGCTSENEVAYVWQRKVLPLSVSYFIADILWYCIPKRDVAITIHHLVMIGCHYPIGEPNGALVAGAGDEVWCVFLSILGYTAEWTTALLNMRWWISHTMTKVSKSGLAFFQIVSFLVLVSYASRLFLMPYLISLIAPRLELYADKRQLLTYAVALLGHIVVLLMSMQWMSYIYYAGGCRNFCTFQPAKTSKAPGQFNFRDELQDTDKIKKRGEIK